MTKLLWFSTAALVCIFNLVACTTPSKSSKAEFLTGKPKAGTTEKAVLDDLARTVYVRQTVAASEQEKQAGLDKDGKSVAQTSTWLKIYPYTEPLVSLRVRKNVEEKAFKERWATDRTELEIQKAVAKDINDNVTSHQCFAVEINTANPAALDLKTWYGTLTSGSMKQPLTFSEGTGFVKTTRTTTISGYGGYYSGTTTDSHEYFLYSNACAAKPIDLGGAFAIEIDARYSHDLLPIRLEWLAPTKTAAPKAVTQ